LVREGHTKLGTNETLLVKGRPQTRLSQKMQVFWLLCFLPPNSLESISVSLTLRANGLILPAWCGKVCLPLLIRGRMDIDG
jgi:hypothetical protein